MNREKKRIIIIGNGKMAKDCAQIVIQSNNLKYVELVSILVDTSRSTISADLKNFCLKNNISFIYSKNINKKQIQDYIISQDPYLIFSINNHQIIRNELLKIFDRKIINFHNSLLPRYGGLNACTWAIYNGEQTHGVTWHYVTAIVDEGDVIAQQSFPIEDSVNAIGLLIRCVKEGVDLFERIFLPLLKGEIAVEGQTKIDRSYYLEHQIPQGGIIDFRKNYRQIDRLVRALNYRPISFSVQPARAFINNIFFYVDKIEFCAEKSSQCPGTILEMNKEIKVKTADGVVALSEIRGSDGRKITNLDFLLRYGIVVGSCFYNPDNLAIEEEHP